MRSERRSLFGVPLGNNPFLIVSIVVAHLVHIGAMFTPGLKSVLALQPVTPGAWVSLLGLALTLLVVDEAAKWWRRRRQSAAVPV